MGGFLALPEPTAAAATTIAARTAKAKSTSAYADRDMDYILPPLHYFALGTADVGGVQFSSWVNFYSGVIIIREPRRPNKDNN